MSAPRLLAPAVEFDAPLEPMTWGRTTYVVLRVPDELVRSAEECGTRRVDGTVEDVAVNLAITRADVSDEPFLWAGSTLRRRLGLRTGDVVRCTLAPVDPDHVAIPDDVRTALVTAGAEAAFEALRPGERRQRLAPVEGAARPETRERRIVALLAGLGA